MRAFDLLAKAEQDIRNASHPRYHFEMVLLRWMHLRKLVPLAELLEQLGGGGAPARSATHRRTGSARSHRPAARVAPTAARVAPTSEHRSHRPRDSVAPTSSQLAPTSEPRRTDKQRVAPHGSSEGRVARRDPRRQERSSTTPSWRRRSGSTSPTIASRSRSCRRTARCASSSSRSRAWLEAAAERAGRPQDPGDVGAGRTAPAPRCEPRRRRRRRRRRPPAKRDLKAEAMSSSGRAGVLDVFPAEIRDVEEM